MFLPGVLKENVDGEALLWAADRARRMKARRHLIIVVGDGAPVDDSTLAANDNYFLWEHLKSVIAELSEDDTICLAAIGLRDHVARLYEVRVDVKFFGDIEQQFLPFLAYQIRLGLSPWTTR
jgi:cobaltochelatase CobT